MTEQEMKQNHLQNNGKTRVLIFGLVIALLIIAGAVIFARYSVNSAKEDIWRNVEKDLNNMAFGRANEVNNGLKTLIEPAERFASATAVKQFAREVLTLGDSPVVAMRDDSGGDDATIQSMEIMRSYLTDIVKNNEFSYGGVSTRSGHMYVYTENTRNTLSPVNQAMVQKVAETNTPMFGHAEADPQFGLVIGVFMPVLVKDSKGADITAAVLYLAKPVGPKLRDLFTFSGYTYSGKGYNAYLLQRTPTGMQIVYYTLDRAQEISPIAPDNMGNIAFAQRKSVAGSDTALSRGAKIVLVDWWVILEQNYADVQRTLDEQSNDIYIMVGLIAMVLLLLVAAAWWWLVGHERSVVLNQFQDLFQVIDEQKRLLDSINSTLADPISLTDTQGIYLYVNRAFAQAVGREAKDIPGLDIAAVFGFDTAKRLNSSDQHVLMTSEGVTINEVIWLQSRRHYFQIAKTPLRESGSRTPQGIVSVFRDMTKVVETEERSRRMVQQTIDALVKAIEATDPFLGGHSRIMGEVARLIVKSMNLSEKDSATIAAAATLSQIGKLYVPREILTKPGQLTEEEKKIMEQHVEHTKDILSGIEFDVPVVEAIEQMNERLDGKGYPLGLSGDEIKIYGRVLAVANAFTAMARPRAYRPAMDAETVLSILEKESGSYDQHIVQILRDVIYSPAGEAIVAVAAQSRTE
jgi:PAS domain S-box-containing protein